MDLNTIDAVSRPRELDEIPAWRDGDAPLAGGTWLFSEPQPALRRLIDLERLGWDALEPSVDGLRIGAMCTLEALAGFRAPAAWRAAALFGPCCDALVASFKVQHCATVGGNLCLALPAGSMAALLAALDGACTLRAPGGAERIVMAAEFVTGPRRTVLGPGELLREMALPAAALTRRTAFRRIALSPLGRSGALLIGTAGQGFTLTVTASTPRPVHLRFASVPTSGALLAALHHRIPDGAWHDDVHGAPDWRRHVTLMLAEEIRRELGGARCG